MAFGLWKTIECRNEDVFEIRILKEGFSGSSVRWNGWAAQGTFQHTYAKIDPENLYKEPVQKSTLEVFFAVESTAQLNELKALFIADEDEYRMEKWMNGSKVWTGKVLPGLLDYPTGSFPFMGSITAKDLSHLEGEDFTLEDNRETIITTIAKLLPDYGLDIYTYTSWTGGTINDLDDYLRQVYNDTIVLRTIDEGSDVDAEEWKKFKCLKEICKANRLILRQENNAWHLFQLSELAERPTTARRTRYNSSGVKQGATTFEDIRVATNNSLRRVLPTSRNIHREALKEIGYSYEHQSGSSRIVFPTIAGQAYPGGAVNDGGNNYYVTNHSFTGNGDEQFRFRARFDPNVGVNTTQKYFWSAACDGHFLKDGVFADFAGHGGDTNLITALHLDTNINTTTGELTGSGGFEDDTLWLDYAPVMVKPLSGGDVLPTGFEENKVYYLRDVVFSGAADYSWKLSSTPNGTAIVPSDNGTGFMQVYLIGSYLTYINSLGSVLNNIIEVTSEDIPDTMDGTLEIYLPMFPEGNFRDVYWFISEANIVNPTFAGEATEYRLTQDGAFTKLNDLDDPVKIYFGDGPFAYSRSSFRKSLTLGDITQPFPWHRRFSTGDNWGHNEIYLKEELDLRRSARRVLKAEMYGTYQNHNLILHDGQTMFFLEGIQTGFENIWEGEFFQLNLESDS